VVLGPSQAAVAGAIYPVLVQFGAGHTITTTEHVFHEPRIRWIGKVQVYVEKAVRAVIRGRSVHPTRAAVIGEVELRWNSGPPIRSAEVVWIAGSHGPAELGIEAAGALDVPGRTRPGGEMRRGGRWTRSGGRSRSHGGRRGAGATAQFACPLRRAPDQAHCRHRHEACGRHKPAQDPGAAAQTAAVRRATARVDHPRLSAHPQPPLPMRTQITFWRFQQVRAGNKWTRALSPDLSSAWLTEAQSIVCAMRTLNAQLLFAAHTYASMCHRLTAPTSSGEPCSLKVAGESIQCAYVRLDGSRAPVGGQQMTAIRGERVRRVGSIGSPSEACS